MNHLQKQENQTIVFSFNNSNLTAINRDGEAWFVGNEVAAALGYSNTRDALRKHCKASEFFNSRELLRLGIECPSSYGMKLIPERDLYRLVMRSKLPAAEAFEEKVVGEILPAIRKTGSYNAQPAIAVPTNLKEALLLAVEQQEKIEELEKRDNALKLIEGDSSSLKVRDAGRELGIGQKRVTEFLLEHKWSCRDSKRRLRPAHYGLSMGYVALDTSSFVNPKTQETMLSDDIRITRKGIVRLAEIFSKEGVRNG
ncbi:hypothetical protein FAI40_10240 [Acetobacteraceae bacterium]|nr:hypothetical protein FAI40_10240 [Acetobacteraceae bacterium]